MSLFATLKQRLSERQQARTDDARTAYRKIVERLADGQEPAIDDIEVALAEIGQTPDGLQSDIEKLNRRRTLMMKLAERPEVESETQRIRQAIAAETEQFESVRERHRQKLTDLNIQAEAYRSRAQAIETAERELLETCMDEDLLRTEKDLKDELGKLSRRQSEIKEDLWGYSPVGKFTDVMVGTTGYEYLSRLARVEKLKNGSRKNSSELHDVQRKARLYREKWIDPKTAEYHTINEQLATLDSQLADIQKQKLVP